MGIDQPLSEVRPNSGKAGLHWAMIVVKRERAESQSQTLNSIINLHSNPHL